MPAPCVSSPAARRTLAVLVAGALSLAACRAEPAAERATTSTTEAGIRCPDGVRPADSPLVVNQVPTGPVDLGGDDAASPASDAALDLGVLLPRTGDLSFLAPAPAAGVSLAVADIAAAGGVLGRPVTVQPSDPTAAGGPAGAADALAASGVDAIIGPITSGATGQVLERPGGPLLVSPGATSAALDELDVDDRLFRTAPTDQLQGRALAAMVLDGGSRSATLAVRADGYGRTIADAFTARFTAAGATIASRVEYEPTDPAIGEATTAGLDLSADAIVVVGLAETARILDALAEAGHAPADRPVYGTDGNLGDRLAELVDDPGAVTCLTGLLPVATPSEAFDARLREHAPHLDASPLDGAAEAYDAVALVAIAATAAGSADPSAIAAGLRDASRGGAECRDLAGCLDRAAGGEDIAYVGASGPARLDADGNRSVATVTEVTLDDGGRLRRMGARAVASA